MPGLAGSLVAQLPRADLHSTTRVVRLDVVVTDAQGRAIRDLNKGDFIILDGGQRQEITDFQAISSDVPLSRPITDDNNSYTNSVTGEGATAILLFDTLNSHWTSQGYALARVRQFLREIEPGDHVGLYVLGDRLRVLHDISHNDSDLVREVRQYESDHQSARWATSQSESTGDVALDHFLSGRDNRYRSELDGGGDAGFAGSLVRDKQQMAARITAASLSAIARQLSGIRGRKEIIWVTDSIGSMSYFELGDMDPYLERWQGRSGIRTPKHLTWWNGTDIERMIRLVNSAGIEVYTVDAEGLQPDALGLRTRPNEAEDPEDFIARIPRPDPDLLEIAMRTGGRAFYNRNDLETAIRRALDDSQFTYSIAYAPDHNNWKGEWRKIQVKVDRPGLTVLARNGYFALPDPRPMPIKNRLQFLSEIAASPVDSGELPLTVHISEPRKAADRILAAVDIPPRSLATMLTPEANGHTVGHFEIMFMQIGAKNKLLDATQKQIDANLKADEYSKMTKGGWALTVPVPVKLGAQTLCVILHDESSDAVGSVRIPLATYFDSASQVPTPRN